MEISEEKWTWSEVMVVKKIRRRVRVLDTSNQTSLFADMEREAVVTAVANALLASRVKFESPDPR